MADDISTEAAYLSAGTATAKINSEIVTQTLDKVNKAGGKSGGSGNAMSDTYNFSKSVLSAVYENKGTIADTDG